ncbi:oligosaccharide flippase family protein [Thalassomonas viridans]|uniref:Oligosaccharide flippase family protein n=1 Tax=Thalassomonas viridans TaxID=137584 RepID=A0AAF0CAN3_9GAMM|nr:oligosaccharide flippase family protein [Thalassomonas viridans]WDE06706.1 oligosaccharide flippase family protein [Thalassomonas viridans]
MSAHTGEEIQTKDYLKKGSLILGLSVIAGFALDYLFNLTLSRALPSHEYGDYKVAFAFATITSVLTLLGGDRVAPRILSGPLSKGDNRSVWEFLRFYLLITAVLSLLVILGTALASYWHIGSSDLQHHHPLLLMSIAIPLISIGALLSRILQSAKYLALSNLPWRIALPLLKISLILLLVAILPEVELWHVVTAGITAVCLIISWQWHKIRQLNLISLQRTPGSFVGNKLLKLSVPMMLAMLITLGINQIDLFLLEMLAPEHEVGLFAAAATTSHILPVVQTTIAGLFLPLIGPALEESVTRSKALFWQGQKLITASILGLLLCLLTAGPWLLSFFGKDYLQAEQALIYLALAYALWGLAAFASTWLQYAGKGTYVIRTGCATLAIDAGCNLWLIPLYGINGAALATLIAMAFAALTTWLLYYKLLGADTEDHNNNTIKAE